MFSRYYTIFWLLYIYGYGLCNGARLRKSNCYLGERTHRHQDVWIYNNLFNVTCITSCRDQSDYTTSIPDEEGSGFENSHFAEECDRGEPVYVRENFMISCEKHMIVGCIDVYGDVVKIGYFVAEKNRLKYCYIYPNGRKARIENKGCFGGSKDDDPEDENFHVPKYKIWRHDNFDLRCGDDGISIYKCHIGNNKTIHSGSGWFDEYDVFNVCK